MSRLIEGYPLLTARLQVRALLLTQFYVSIAQSDRARKTPWLLTCSQNFFMSHKLLEIGSVYQLIAGKEPTIVEKVGTSKASILGFNDLFLVLDSKVEYRRLSKLTHGNTIQNKILVEDEIYIFWYWDDCDFYIEIEKYLKKVC